MAHYQGEPGFLAWADSVDASVASLPSTYMDLTNAQTAAGNKTFSGVLTATTDFHANAAAFVGNATYYNSVLNVLARSSTETGIVVRGASGQSVDLQAWEDNLGNVLARMKNDGTMYGLVFGAGSTGYIGGALSAIPVNNNSIGVVVQGQPSQVSDLQQWQDTTGAILSRIHSDGSYHYNIGSGATSTVNNSSGFWSAAVGAVAIDPRQTPLVIKGATAQSQPLTEWQNSTGAVLVNVTGDGSLFAGHSQLFSDAQALSFTTGAFFQASTDTVRPVVLRAHSATQSGSLLELQASSTAVLAYFDSVGLFHQFGVAGASVGTRFVNNTNNADLHFASTGDGIDYIVLGILGSSFQAPSDATVPIIIAQHSGTQSASLTRWTNAATSVIIAQVTGTGNVQGTGAYTTLSDASAKENVGPLRFDPAQVVRGLKPVHFDYLDGERDQVGFIAQDVQSVLPHAVVPWDDNGTLGFRSEVVLAYLVAAVQPLIEDYLTRTAERTKPHVSAP